ncbi:AAA family ATPase [Xanthobacter sp. KR7-225]|uniref:AAA family ATPase n=1 Tax=Xanthobacter sp. KR7-225 TaxID=3156613 RepID=UPI0032B45361
MNTRPSLTLTRFADFPRAPRKDWLVHGLLGTGELSCFFGPPGSGKSALVGDLAAHVAGGLPWFGRRVMAGPVLYVAAERAALVQRRLSAFGLYHGLDDMPLGIVSGAVDLRGSHHQAQEIVGHAMVLREEAGDVRLIVVDTVSRALAGGDENSPKDMGALIANIGLIQEATGSHVLLVHHVPADGSQRMRGHGALLGAVDCTIGIEKTEGARVANLDKANDVGEDVRLAFNLESVTLYTDPDTGEETTAPVVVSCDVVPSAPKASDRLSASAKIALRALQEAIGEKGEKPPSDPHIPPSALVTTESEWRSYAYARGITNSPEPRARQLAFKRAAEALLLSSRVAQWERHVWLT